MNEKKGFGLIVSIFVVLLFSLLSIIAASMFSTDIQISLDSLFSTQAYYLAEAAKSLTRFQLDNDPNWLHDGNNKEYTYFIEPNRAKYRSKLISNVPIPGNTTYNRYLEFEFTGTQNYVSRKLYCKYQLNAFRFSVQSRLDFRVDYMPTYIVVDQVYEDAEDNVQKITFDKQKLFDKINPDNIHLYYPNDSIFQSPGFDGIMVEDPNLISQYVMITPDSNDFEIYGSIIAPDKVIRIETDGNIRIHSHFNYPAIIGARIEINCQNNGNIEMDGGVFAYKTEEVSFESGKIIIDISDYGTLTLSGITYADALGESDTIRVNMSINGTFISRGTMISNGEIDINNQDDSTVKIIFDKNIVNNALFGLENLPEDKTILLNWRETSWGRIIFCMWAF